MPNDALYFCTVCICVSVIIAGFSIRNGLNGIRDNMIDKNWKERNRPPKKRKDYGEGDEWKGLMDND
jgi:hypothetical protein